MTNNQVKKKIYFWQPQQHTNFQGRYAYWLPYTVGCLWSYVKQNPEIQDHYELGDFYFRRTPVDQVIASIEDIDVAVFSCYMWNWEYNKTMAEAVKKKWPHCKIIFGGPQVTEKPLEKRFFPNHPYVDHIINGEGEIAFEELLIQLARIGKARRHIIFTRLKDLSYPSPYSSGIFDDLISKYPDLYWQAVLETNRGCPYACTFCDWGSLTYAKITKIPEQRVIDDIDWISRNRVMYVFIADANFGIFHERDKEFAQYINHVQKNRGYPKVVLAQWAKNGREKILDVAKIFFNDYNRGFTVSVQSMDDTVLDAIKRKNMDISDMKVMLDLCQERDIPAYTELILALPYETAETWRENHYKLMEVGQHHSIDIWWTGLLENAELNSYEQRTKHEIKSIQLPKRITGSIDHDSILEYENLVLSTRYMTTEEMIDCFVFSSMVMNLHYVTGATNVLSRILHRLGKKTYRQFYDYLEQEIMGHDHWISRPFHYLKNALTEIFSGRYTGGGEFDDVFYNLHSGSWNAGKHTLLDPEKTLESVFSIVTPESTSLTQDLYEEIKDLAQRQLVKWDDVKKYPMIKNYQYDIYRYAIGKSDIIDKPCTLMFKYDRTWDDPARFLEHAYFDRRTRKIVNAQIEVIDS